MQTLYIHPKNPQERLLTTVITTLKSGGIAILPTENGYRFALTLNNKNAFERLMRLGVSVEDLQVLCTDISQMSHYAHIDNDTFLILKRHLSPTHGFVLEPTKALGKKITDKALVFTISHTPLIEAILSSLQEPIFISPLIYQNERLTDHLDISDKLDTQVDVFVDVGMLDDDDIEIV